MFYFNNKKFYLPFSRDKIFGSIGHAFSYKWKGIGYAHPYNEIAIHWARLATKNDPNTITILTILDNKWYQNHTPYTGFFLDTYIIAHIPTYIITYEEPTIPLELNKPRVEPSTIHILYVQYGNNNVGNIEQINVLITIFNNLLIPLLHTQIVSPTPPNIQVKKSKKWNAHTYPITYLAQNNKTPPLPNYETNKPLKFPSKIVGKPIS